MKKILESLCKKCKEHAEDKAMMSYETGQTSFRGFYCAVEFENKDYIEIYCDENGFHDVYISIGENEKPNIEKFIAMYLDENAKENEIWQQEYENDDSCDVDPGCDPAFPHYGDFERWAYGY